MDDCVFCKIVKGEIPATKIYEDEIALAFLDIFPVSPGHTLVIPKEHYENFLAIPEETLRGVISASQKVAKAVVKGTGAEGFNFTQNNGKVAGQAVNHLHFHIIPRVEGDGLKHWPHKDYTDGEEQKISEKIKINL
jgi:histidine triad (HIT) family protein